MKKFISIAIFFLLSIGFLSAQHLKKDGTPDMRYKENREKNSSTSETPSTKSPITNSSLDKSTTHLKKDGTPDMRYKENRANSSKNSKSKKD